MSSEFDLVIRGGMIVDGSGGVPFVGDVAISDGLIRQTGLVEGIGTQELDANGKMVTPGFVDIHTHYDGQVSWENSLSPSSDHGVTTVVMGNCGVGFAPCRPEQREMLLKVMEGVEDIPGIVMTEGVPWRWNTFPEYLDFLSERRFDIDCAAYLPHAALRVFVMGARGAAGEASTEEDRERMTAMVTEAVNAGAIGISTSRTLFHRDADGQLAPHVLSGRLELLALAQGLRNAGRGVFQVAPGLSNHQLKDFVDTDTELTAEQYAEQEIDLLSEIAAASGRTLMFTLTDMQEAPGLYHYVLELLAKKNAGDVSMRAQIFPRPIGILFGLDLSLNPFKLHPSYQAIEGLPFAERLAKLRTPELRARILAEKASGDAPDPILQFLVSRSLDGYRMGDQANYDPDPEMKLTEEAARRGMTVWEVAYELMIEGDGKSILYLPLNNFSDGGLDSVHEMLSHPDTVIGLGDGGAHYGLICDASFPTFVLTYWTRDRDGKRLSLPMAVNALTRRSALAVGLDDRGLIAPGYKGDLNVIDYQNLFSSSAACQLYPAG